MTTKPTAEQVALLRTKGKYVIVTADGNYVCGASGYDVAVSPRLNGVVTPDGKLRGQAWRFPDVSLAWKAAQLLRRDERRLYVVPTYED